MRYMLGLRTLLLVLVCQVISIGKSFAPEQVKEGDIIFQTSLSAQSRAIQIATGSKYSHCGIILKQNNALFVLEAINPVQFTPVAQWIKRGDRNKFVIKRLKNNTLLTSDALSKLHSLAMKYQGKPYDSFFGWGNDRIYCSELIWKMYNEALGIQLGSLQKLKEFNIKNKYVMKKMKERYGDNIPLDETVVSPAAIFASDYLTEVKVK